MEVTEQVNPIAEKSNVQHINNHNTQEFNINRLRIHDNVKTITSIDRIGIILGYLAQCDYICGNNGDDLNSDELFGRGYLLDMLSQNVLYFAEEYENTEKLAEQYLQQQKLNADQSKPLKAQVTYLKGIINKYEQLNQFCLLYTSPSPRDMRRSRMPSSA